MHPLGLMELILEELTGEWMGLIGTNKPILLLCTINKLFSINYHWLLNT